MFRQGWLAAGARVRLFNSDLHFGGSWTGGRAVLGEMFREGGVEGKGCGRFLEVVFIERWGGGESFRKCRRGSEERGGMVVGTFRCGDQRTADSCALPAVGLTPKRSLERLSKLFGCFPVSAGIFSPSFPEA